jgi:hypothetical protein
MEKSPESGKYRLQSQLRTWSGLKRLKAEEKAAKDKAEHNSRPPIPDPQRRNTLSQFLPNQKQRVATSSSPPPQKWGGCAAGCDHHHDQYPRRNQRKATLPPDPQPVVAVDSLDAAPTDGSTDEPASSLQSPPVLSPSPCSYLTPGRDGGGTDSGAQTPAEGLGDDEESDYFDPLHQLPAHLAKTSLSGANLAKSAKPEYASGAEESEAGSVKAVKRRPSRKPTEEDLERWASESGMGRGRMADALGDEPEEDQEDDVEGEVVGAGEDVEIGRAEKKDRGISGSVY